MGCRRVEGSGLGFYTADGADGEELADGEMEGPLEEEQPPCPRRRNPQRMGKSRLPHLQGAQL